MAYLWQRVYLVSGCFTNYREGGDYPTHNSEMILYNLAMAQSRCSIPRDIETAFSRFPPKQRSALVRTWETALATLQGVEQCIAWGMPSLRIDGELVLSMEGFSRHNSIFPGPGVIERISEKLEKLTVTKGTIHFERDKPMSTSLIKAIITARILEINDSYPRPNGQFKEFYKDGVLKARGKYKLDELHGNWEWFRRDGTLKRSGQFKSGRQVGTWITFDSTGAPYRETLFS
jgi:uncharacterized protein YdhG (YjbR/CyaY superfamily)